MEEKDGIKNGFSLSYEFKALIDVLFDPFTLFQNVLKHKKFWIPILVIIMFSAPQLLITNKIHHTDAIKSIELNPKIKPETKDMILKRIEDFNPIKNFLRNFLPLLIFEPLGIVVISGLILFFATLMGGNIRFVEILTITSYASYIDWLWGNIIKTILAIKKGSFLLVSTGLSLFTTPDIFSKTYRILSIFDFFNIWSYIVIGIGLSVLMKINLKKAFLISLIVYVIKIAVSIIPNILF